jgi:hypothetical protein
MPWFSLEHVKEVFILRGQTKLAMWYFDKNGVKE